MLTIGYSTRKHNPNFTEYLKTSSGLKNIRVIEKINNGEKSLSQVYNEILSESETEIVVICHDDIYFDSKRWGEKIISHFSKTDFGILGVAGTTFLPKSGQWWEDSSKMIGIVNHESQGKKWESKYSEDLNSDIHKTVIVDGLFIAINKPKIKHNFDESVKGFHLYDVTFCFKNFLEDVKVGVLFNIRITHKSVGQTNNQWEENRQIFSETFHEKLPAKIKLCSDDKLKILFLLKNPDDYFAQITSEFNKNQDISIISQQFTSEQKKSFNKINIKTFRIHEIPGYRMGDGRSFVRTENGIIVGEMGKYYKTSSVNYDVIIVDNKEYFDIIKPLFSLTPKIILDKDSSIYQHDSVIAISEAKSNIFDIILSSLNKVVESKQKIKIVSGFSERGGSTIALINLTNYFNQNGIDCTFYGPHLWHLSQCKSDLLSNLKLIRSDKLIVHSLQLKERPSVSKVILSSHEKWWFPVGKIPKFWDNVIFLHDNHRDYHSDYYGEYDIIPNLKENLVSTTKKQNVELVAGIIGTIESRKQTHLSIERALSDGCEKIYLFGRIGEQDYFEKNVKDKLKDSRIEMVGFQSDKQKMYDSIGRVYHTSKGEVACLVKDECYLTGTLFFGNEETENEVSTLTNLEILNLWKKVLEI